MTTTSATAMTIARMPLSIESWPRLGPMLCTSATRSGTGQRAGAEHEREILRVGERPCRPS